MFGVVLSQLLQTISGPSVSRELDQLSSTQSSNLQTNQSHLSALWIRGQHLSHACYADSTEYPCIQLDHVVRRRLCGSQPRGDSRWNEEMADAQVPQAAIRNCTTEQDDWVDMVIGLSILSRCPALTHRFIGKRSSLYTFEAGLLTAEYVAGGTAKLRKFGSLFVSL